MAPKPPPSVTLIQTVSNGTTTFNYTSFNDWNNNNNVRNQQNGGNNMVNLGGGILNFNPAQQYTPASEVLPGYQPGNRATLPAPAVSFFTNKYVTGLKLKRKLLKTFLFPMGFLKLELND